mgnify:CR=1 FL=1
MLGRNYIKVNGVALPTPVSFEDNSELFEDVNQSEAATDLVSFIRGNRAVFNMTFQVTSGWRDTLKTICSQTSVTLTYKSTNYTGRFRRAGTWELFKGSHKTPSTDGLWTCPCVFIEI